MSNVQRIVESSVWYVFFGAEQGLDVYIGDEESWKSFGTQPPTMIAGFVKADEVLAALDLKVEETPFVQSPGGRQGSANLVLDTVFRAMSSDYARPTKESLDAFASRHGKTIKLFSLKRDRYDGVAVREQFKTAA